MLHERLFPELAKFRWGEINLDLEAQIVKGERNELLDPYFCELWVERITSVMARDFTYGGYLEDRSTLWRGHYHKPGQTIHLGIDYNVPAGTKVYAPFSGEVVHSWADPDENGGWGGRLIIKYEPDKFCIFGHLKKKGLPVAGSWLPSGAQLGVVANFPENGNWFPHLHVQGMSERMYNLVKSNPESIDGYAAMYEGIERDWPKVV